MAEGIKTRGRPKGIPKTGGRQKGTLNKSTAEVKVIAGKHGEAAIKELARLALKAESETARIQAIRELLDRAYGKAPQAITGEDGGPMTITVYTGVPRGDED